MEQIKESLCDIATKIMDATKDLKTVQEVEDFAMPLLVEIA